MPFETLVKQGYADWMHYTYVLKSESADEFYYGSSTNLQKRLSAHNAGQNISTKKYRPWRIVWYGAFETKASAELFEKYLKTASGKAFLRKRLL